MDWKDRQFIVLVSDYMSEYTWADCESLDNVKMINKYNIKVKEGRLISKLLSAWLSVKMNAKVHLPMKSVFYDMLFGDIRGKQNVVISVAPAWYDKQLLIYCRKNFPGCKIYMRFHDKVEVALKAIPYLSINDIRAGFDGVLVYSDMDVEKYGFQYCSEGYSALNSRGIEVSEEYDVAFIGAAKDRLEDIHKAYRLFTAAGLKCYFYVTGVEQDKRVVPGIIYAESTMPFAEYIHKELQSKCLFELLQKGSSGRTYRMMEAIIYNKKLITNCGEILSSRYYDRHYVQYYEDIEDIDASFVTRDVGCVDYHYDGEYSPIRILEYLNQLG